MHIFVLLPLNQNNQKHGPYRFMPESSTVVNRQINNVLCVFIFYIDKTRIMLE